MINKTKYCLLVSLLVFITACEKERKIISEVAIDEIPLCVMPTEISLVSEDLSNQNSLKDRFNPIRKNFQRINARRKWNTIAKEELWESTQGGEAVFYYQNGQLEKVITRHFGEMGQTLAEYYLLNGKLSFVFEQSYQYNRPLTWNETAIFENNDTEIFEIEKSVVGESRSYFENEELIQKIESTDTAFTQEYLKEEESRITSEFEKLIEYRVNKV